MSAQPGKTKHFQTINLDEQHVTLCDCPGLVFPSFTNSKAEMVCGGVICIDQITDFDTPMILVVKRISRKTLEPVYKIKLPDKDVYMSASHFLQILARERGYVTGSATPDIKKTAKMVLKDYVNGKLLYCHLRPDYDRVKHGEFEQEGIGDIMQDVASLTTTPKPESKTVEKAICMEETKTLAKADMDKVQISGREEVKLVFTTEATKAGGKIDQEFFTQAKPITEMKLNKEQKRQLKFAIKRGEVSELNQLNRMFQR